MLQYGKVDSEGHTILSNVEETAFQTGLLFLYPMGLGVSIIMFIILFIHFKIARTDTKNNKYYIYQVQTGITSIIGGIIYYIVCIFFMTNTFISWNYDDQATTAFDSFAVIGFVTVKLFFYLSFTFNVQSVINKPFSTIFIFFISLECGLFIGFSIWGVTADITSFDSKEVDIDTKHNIMILSNPKESYPPLIGVLLIDWIYCIVLCIYYVKSLRNKSKIFDTLTDDGVKGLILMWFSTAIYFLCVILAISSEFRYWANVMFIYTDNINLFLLTKTENSNKLFNSLCGACCGNCCGKWIYGNGYIYKGYHKVSNDNEQDVDTVDNGGGDTDALI